MRTLDEQHLHIVSFDVPLPANYGGVIDVFYKVKALHSLGVKVHLHCFSYGREDQPQLKKFCEKVYYYPRNMNKSLLIHPLPFIIVSRQHDALLEHLLRDRHPILFEGLHCCYYLDHPQLTERKRFVRTHNVEHEYYRALANGEPSYLKRLYLRKEAKKLRRAERLLSQAEGLLAISPPDLKHFVELNPNTVWVPPFHADEVLAEKREKSPFALYHGNLSVLENEKAALFLINEVFLDPSKPLVVFGNDPSRRLRKKVASIEHIELIEGTSDELREMVQTAQVNVLPTFQATGMKLKLLFSLFNGGHCLVNEQMVKDTGLEVFCEVTHDAPEMREALEDIWSKEIKETDLKERSKVLNEQFSNLTNAQEILKLIKG